MSTETRIVALQAAVTLNAEDVLATAQEFDDFLNGGDKTPVKAAPAKAAPAKAAPAKAAPAKAAPAKKKAAAPVEDDDAAEEEEAADDEAEETEEETEAEDGEVSKKEVGEAVAALLNADMRDKALELFKKYKAESLSSIKPKHYAAFKQDAEDALMSGG